MNLFNDYTSFYFYSTLFQGNMALLALGGVFVVYRMQIHASMIAAHDAEIVRIVSVEFGNVLPAFVSEALLNPSTFLSVIDTYNREHGEGNNIYIHANNRLLGNQQIKQISIARDHSLGWQELIRRKFRPPFEMILALTFVSLLAIPFSSSIHCFSAWLEGGLFSVLTIFEGIALWQTKQLILLLID